MSGMDGISSLQKMLGALKVSDSPQVHGGVSGAKLAGTVAQNAATAAPGTSSADRASLSASGGLAATSDMSDVRMAKVAELRQAIASGSYNVPASAVADKMVESLLR